MPFKVTPKKHSALVVSQISESPQTLDKSGLWRDPAWQAIGVVVAVVIALLSALVGWKRSRRKNLSYSVISVVKILNLEESVKARVQITYESMPIQNLYLMVIRFTNSGNTPIPPTDYFRPLSITLDKKSEILSTEVIRESPKKLGVVVSHTSHKVDISSVLLNQKDYFELKILATNLNDISVDGRVAGIRAISKKESQSSSNIWLPATVAIALTTAITTFMVLLTKFPTVGDILKVGAFIIAMVSSILMVSVQISEMLKDFLKRRN
ncbi:MAG: hypothetical protein AAFZ17_04395 [Cyanobacteria bacterium J06650_10]